MNHAERVREAERTVLAAVRRYARQRGKPDMRRIGSPSYEVVIADAKLSKLEAAICPTCGGTGVADYFDMTRRCMPLDDCPAGCDNGRTR